MDKVIYSSQNASLNKLFGVLPQIIYWLIGGLRLIVAVPLFLFELSELGFFPAPWLTIVMAAIVVAALEVIGFLASVLTAYFRSIALTAGFYFALGIAFFIVFFNAYMLQSIDNMKINFTTLVLFQVINAMSFLLGEATGFLVVSLKEPDFQIERNENIENDSENTETNFENPENLAEGKLTAKLAIALKEEGYKHKEIAALFNTSISTVSRMVNLDVLTALDSNSEIDNTTKLGI